MTQPQLALMDADLRHADDKAAVIEAVATAARLHGNRISRNEIAPHIPAWVYHRTIGATISGLVARRILHHDGWVESQDHKGKNHGKPARRYVVDLPALAALVAEGER